MSATSAARHESMPPVDFQGARDGDATSSQRKCLKSQGRRLLTDNDILSAAEWRLSGWSAADLEICGETVAQLIEQGVPLDEQRADVVEAMASFPSERRDSWSALCAFVALYADAHGDERLFLIAGMELMTAYRQAKNSQARRNGDALSRMIHDYVKEMPNISPQELWQDFCTQAQEGWGGILVDSDSESISFEEYPGAPIEDIGRTAFLRRVQREKKKRQQPADVATVD